jgi:cell division control protein 6
MNKEIERIFDSFTKETIFKNKLILQSNYSPENIPHREKQIKQVASIIAPSLRLEKPSNLFIYGKTGTGKTLTVHYVINQLLKRAKEQNINLKIPYINCKLKKVADTEYRILAELIKKMGSQVPATGLPTDQVYQKFLEIVDSKKQLILIVLDEIDQAVGRIGDSFLYNFTRLNSELSKAQIAIIGISNDLMFLDNVDPRVRSSLSEEELVFSPYDALQLQDILKQRTKEAFKKGVIVNEVIAKCAAYAAREHGDARRALDLIRIAGELVEREGKEKITFEYIDQANKKIESDKVFDIVETYPKQFKIALFSIIKLLNDKTQGGRIFTGDIYNLYRELCAKTKTEQLTQRRLGDMIAEFDMAGIINARVISKGRHGRTREIRMDIPQSMMEKIRGRLREDLF